MNDDSIFQKVSLPSCPHSTEQIKRVYLSDNQQHEHIQSLNSKVCQPSHFELVLLIVLSYLFFLLFAIAYSLMWLTLITNVTKINHKCD